MVAAAGPAQDGRQVPLELKSSASEGWGLGLDWFPSPAWAASAVPGPGACRGCGVSPVLQSPTFLSFPCTFPVLKLNYCPFGYLVLVSASFWFSLKQIITVKTIRLVLLL